MISAGVGITGYFETSHSGLNQTSHSEVLNHLKFLDFGLSSESQKVSQFHVAAGYAPQSRKIVYGVCPKKSTDKGKEGRSGAPLRTESMEVGNRAVNRLQLVCDNNRAATRQFNHQHDEDQCRQANDEYDARREPFRQGHPKWLESFHAHQLV